MVDLVDRPPDRGVQAVSALSRGGRGRPPRRCGSCTSGSATSSARTRRGTPSTRPTRRLGDRRVHAAAAPSSPTRSAPRTGSTRSSRAPATATASTSIAQPRARPTPPRDHDAWLALLRVARRARGDDHRHRGRATCAAPTAGSTRPRRGPADVDALRRDPAAPVRTAPARLLAGLAARRRADAGPLDARPLRQPARATAPSSRGSSRDLAELVDPGLRDWLEDVRRHGHDDGRPDHAAHDRRGHARGADATGSTTAARWSPSRSASGCSAARFAGGRPRWEDAGATFTDDVAPFEQRKLWLLNGGHSLLAYAGSARGHETVAEAVADDDVPRVAGGSGGRRRRAHLTLPAEDVARYRDALLERFANPRMRHRLAQIAADGSQKLPIRIAARAARRARRRAGCRRAPRACSRPGSCHLRGAGAPVTDPRADELVALAAGPLPRGGARASSSDLDPALAADDEVVAAVRRPGRAARRGDDARRRSSSGSTSARPASRPSRSASARPGAGWRSASTRCCSRRPASRCRTPTAIVAAAGRGAGRVRRRGRGRARCWRSR